MTELLGKSYGEIENHEFEQIIQNSLGHTLDLTAEGLPPEVQSGNRFFRLSVDPIVSQGISTGSIVIVGA